LTEWGCWNRRWRAALLIAAYCQNRNIFFENQWEQTFSPSRANVSAGSTVMRTIPSGPRNRSSMIVLDFKFWLDKGWLIINVRRPRIWM
jgi:hypothetical protein